jgi:hypothetical protein
LRVLVDLEVRATDVPIDHSYDDSGQDSPISTRKEADHQVMVEMMNRGLRAPYFDRNAEKLAQTKANLETVRSEVRRIEDWRYRWLYYDWLEFYQFQFEEAEMGFRNGFEKRSMDSYRAARDRERERQSKYDAAHQVPKPQRVERN